MTSSILGKLGTNFLAAAFVPSLWFVISAELLFAPLSPAGSESRFAPPISLEDSLITLVFTLVIGFTLMALNTFLYKLLEGYYFLERFSGLRRRHMVKSRKRQREYEVRDWLANHLRDINRDEPDLVTQARRKKQLDWLRQSSRDLKASFKQDYPSRPDAALPTRFGNILKSAEQYANENYSIDSVVIWPRLIHVIAPAYYQKLDESNNGLAFIVNCMVLSVVLAVLSFGVAGYQVYQSNATAVASPAAVALSQEQALMSAGRTNGEQALVIRASGARSTVGSRNPLLYAGSALFFLGIAWFLYNVSLPAARQYGNLFRSAFDLFRFDLLSQLRLPLPDDENADTLLWDQVSGFLALGGLDSPRREPFRYIHPKGRDSAPSAEEEE